MLDSTPFYAEQGGQAADTGSIASSSCRFAVHDTRVGFAAHGAWLVHASISRQASLLESDLPAFVLSVMSGQTLPAIFAVLCTFCMVLHALIELLMLLHVCRWQQGTCCMWVRLTGAWLLERRCRPP